jgi:hypothetical protein
MCKNVPYNNINGELGNIKFFKAALSCTEHYYKCGEKNPEPKCNTNVGFSPT